MNQDLNFSRIQEIQSRIPVVSDKLVYRLKGIINKSEDLIKFNENQDVWGFAWSILTASSDRYDSKKQQSVFNKNNADYQKIVVDWIQEISDKLTITQLCLVDTQTFLLKNHFDNQEIKDEIRKTKEEIRILKIENKARQDYDRIVSSWKAGKTYTNLPWLIEIALLAREIFSSSVFIYELESGNDKYYRNLLIHNIIDKMKNRNEWREGFFSLADLLNLTCDEIKPDDIKLITFLFIFVSNYKQSLRNQPHLFLIGKTLQLANLSTKDKPSNPGKTAFDMCRSLTNKIYRTTDVEEIITLIVNETANDFLAIMYENTRFLKTLQPQEDSSNISSTKTSKTAYATENKLNRNTKYGLVLAGGGARGAYQVGALQYIAELVESEQIQQPQIIAGTSIGALNGAVLASHQPFSTGVSKLNELWDLLAQAPILVPNWPAFIKYSTKFLRIQPQLIELLLELTGLNKNSTSLFSTQPIEELLQEAVPKDGLQKGIELWVAAFPSLNINKVRSSIGLPVLNFIPDTVQDYVVDWSRAWQGQEAEYFRVQDDIDNGNFYKLLLASAALPLAFPKQKVNEQSYVDGGLADNVPLKALAKDSCTHIIVIHLDNGYIRWDSSDFPTKNIIEIRPRSNIRTNLIDFSRANIATLPERGYEDAKYVLDDVLAILATVKDSDETLRLLLNSTDRLR